MISVPIAVATKLPTVIPAMTPELSPLLPPAFFCKALQELGLPAEDNVDEGLFITEGKSSVLPEKATIDDFVAV